MSATHQPTTPPATPTTRQTTKPRRRWLPTGALMIF